MTLQQELAAFSKNLPIIDVHEHIINDQLRLIKYPDYIALAIANYVRTAACASGISEEVILFLQEDNPLSQKYPQFIKAMAEINHTYVFKAMEIAFKHIYDIDLLAADFMANNQKYAAKNKPGITEQIAKQYHIKAAINDVFFPTMQHTDYRMGNDILKNSARCDRYIMVQNYVQDIEREFSQKLPTLACFIAQFKAYLKLQVEKYGALAIKIGVAYERSLKFEDNVQEEEANALYLQMYAALAKGEQIEQITKLEDYLAHQVISEAQSYGLVVQIHTGIHEGNGNILENSHPLLLNNLFGKYPQLKFDVFHIGYPYAREIGVLLRTYPNVYTNFSWAYILAPEYANDILEEYIGLAPINKISVFGGDFMHIEGSIGQLIIIQDFLSKRLAKMIEQEKLTIKQAKIILEKLFYQNAAHLYNLPIDMD